MLINANDGQGMKQVTSKIEEVMKEEIEREAKKGRTGKTIRALVLRNSKCTENHLL